MLICMAWHRHLASRYGGRTFLSLFFFACLFWASSEFLEQGEKPLYRRLGRDQSWMISRLLAPFAYGRK